MAQRIGKTPLNVVERNITLTGQVMQYLLDNPELLASLPQNFELVVLPEDDPEMRHYNLELLDSYGADNRPIVFARIRTQQEMGRKRVKPSLFVPLTASFQSS